MELFNNTKFVNVNLYQFLIDFAIEQENDAYAFYKEVAEKVSNPRVKKLFLKLAIDEQGHANLLEKYKNDNSIAEKFKTTHTDY